MPKAKFSKSFNTQDYVSVTSSYTAVQLAVVLLMESSLACNCLTVEYATFCEQVTLACEDTFSVLLAGSWATFSKQVKSSGAFMVTDCDEQPAKSKHHQLLMIYSHAIFYVFNKLNAMNINAEWLINYIYMCVCVYSILNKYAIVFYH